MVEQNHFDDDQTPADPSGKAPPPLPKPLSHDQRTKLFGSFSYKFEPMPGDLEKIRITDDFVLKNIVTVPIPMTGAIRHARVHRLIAKQFVDLWAAWDAKGLVKKHILTVDGFFMPRFMRGHGGEGDAFLSNHSLGTAFDLNAPWNHQHTRGAEAGKQGSTRELIPDALKHGFLNGLEFHDPDPMHFEAYKICYG